MAGRTLPAVPNSPVETSPLVSSSSSPRHSGGPAGTAPSPSNHQEHRSSMSSEQFHSGSSSEHGYSINSHQALRRVYSSRESSTSALNANARPPSGFEDLTPEMMGLSGGQVGANYSRYSSMPSRGSAAGLSGFADSPDDMETGYIFPQGGSYYGNNSPGSRESMASFTQGEMVKTATTDALLWDEKNQEVDDYIHNPDPGEYKGRDIPPGLVPVLNPTRKSKSEFNLLSWRGMSNVIGLFVVLGGLVGIFAFWPIAQYIEDQSHRHKLAGWNIGGINSSGQVPEIEGLPLLIDADTPDDVKTYKGFDGRDYVLVFSDEFNQDGRTFWPGDDPFWEAVELNYWATVNYEWCDPDAITTKDGNLEITMTEQPIMGHNFRSGFLQSWNKFCFNKDAFIEINVSLPGDAKAMGFWPGLWTMGNLGRAGFGATNDGTWPYSYDSCDVGTLPNQTWSNLTGPSDSRHSGSQDYGGSLSYLPGQRLSACTCKGDDHPGPNTHTGRSAPEIDILEAQVDYHGYGTASQSVQIAPFDTGYFWDNSSTGWTQHNANTSLNLWKGSITQESASAVTILDSTSYDGAGYQTFGYELHAGLDDGYITWTANKQATWTLHSKAFAPNEGTGVSYRLITEEPMYIMLNLFISSKFQGNPNFGALKFPATFRIDYVRVYQPKGKENIGCDPSDRPTAKYIQDHLAAYINRDAKTWEQAGFQWPRNSMADGGCDTERAGP